MLFTESKTAAENSLLLNLMEKNNTNLIEGQPHT